jgi:hypothetical protein
MELTEGAQKAGAAAQQRGREQITLRQKSPAAQLGVLALAHDPEHRFVGLFQILQEDAFKVAAAVRIAKPIAVPRNTPTPRRRPAPDDTNLRRTESAPRSGLPKTRALAMNPDDV